MPGVFGIQGFGFQSDWNGELTSRAAGTAMARIAETNANAISIVPRYFTEERTSSRVIADPGKTESQANLETAIGNAHALGLDVLLKPMLSPLDGTGQMSLAPDDVAAFFASYKVMIVELAQLAQRTGVEQLSIGNELSSLSGAEYRGYWLDIIAAVRDVYDGTVTYAAATDEAIDVSFWDAVDVIGVNAYPPLTTELEPTVEEMIAAWYSTSSNDYWAAVMNHQSPVDFFHSLSLQYDRPLMFTETGYRSLDGTNIRPGGWTVTNAQDVQEQYDAFEAFFHVWSGEGSWFLGAHIWDWDPSNVYAPTGYSPMDKPAEQLITDWFDGAMQATSRTVEGSAGSDLIDVGAGNDALSGGLGNDTIRGGGGQDTIVGGLNSIPRLQSTTVTITGFGSVVDGTGARMVLLVNGQQVGNVAEFGPAATAADYQTFTFTFANPVAIDSLQVAFINDTRTAGGDRNLYIKDITVNGEHLNASDATNTSSPGTWNLYHNRSIDYDMRGRQSLFFGATTDDDVLDGGAGHDALTGGAGNDTLIGGLGNDTFNFAPGFGHDRIVDFAGGAGSGDRIDISAFAGVDTLAEVLAHARQSGNDTVFDFGGGDVLVLDNVRMTELHADDFVGVAAPGVQDRSKLVVADDTENKHSWTKVTSAYDRNGALDHVTIKVDDGHTYRTDYDQDSAFVWKEAITAYDSRNALEYVSIRTDADSILFTYYDAHDAHIWSQAISGYDAAGRLDYVTTVYDDGRSAYTEYDQAGTSDINYGVYHYDAGNHLTVSYIVYDDGRTLTI
jgi:hypothetical protein